MRAPDPVATGRLRSLGVAAPVTDDVGEAGAGTVHVHGFADDAERPTHDVVADDSPTGELPLAWAPPQTLGEHVRAAVLARVPLPLRGGHLDPGRRGLLLVAVLGVVAVAVAVGLALHGRARPAQAVAPPVAVSPDALTSAPPVLVDVEGTVGHPGLVRLVAGARVADAIAAAGGALPGTDTSGLDLAQKVTDGQQLRVGAPVAGAAAASGAPSSGGSPGGSSGGAGAGTAGGLVDLNTATAEQLDALPRVGPTTAQKIIAWRTQHGSFTSVSQLQQVDGIGPSTYAQIAPRVTV